MSHSELFGELGDYEDERKKETEDFVNSLNDMISGEGEHKEHMQEKVGRCVYCSCGMRAQIG